MMKIFRKSRYPLLPLWFIVFLVAIPVYSPAATLVRVETKPIRIEGGQPLEVIITLDKPGDVTVKLTSSNLNIINLQNFPVRLRHVSLKSFIFQTNPIAGNSQFVNIFASTGARTRMATFSVTPPGVLSGNATPTNIQTYFVARNDMDDLFRLAEEKGYHFDRKVEVSTGTTSTCSIIKDGRRGIGLRAKWGGPLGSSVLGDPLVWCKFRLFGGQNTLKYGWTLKYLHWSKVPQPYSWQWISAPQFGSNKPSFILRLIIPQGTTPGPINLYLQGMSLTGPKGKNWKDAF